VLSRASTERLVPLFLARNLASSLSMIWIDAPNLETKQTIFRVQDIALLIKCDGDFNHIQVKNLSVPCISKQEFRRELPTVIDTTKVQQVVLPLAMTNRLQD
jgi:hypothetical protein